VEASRAFGQETGHHFEDADYSHVEGIAAWSQGDLEVAQRHLAEAHRIHGAYELPFGFAYTGPSLARVLVELGNDRDAERLLVDFRDNLQHPTARANAKSIAAVVAARGGDLDRALRLSQEAMELALATDLLMDQGDVALERAEVVLLAGRPAEARAAAEDALARFERKEYAIGIRRARELLARLPG